MLDLGARVDPVTIFVSFVADWFIWIHTFTSIIANMEKLNSSLHIKHSNTPQYLAYGQRMLDYAGSPCDGGCLQLMRTEQ